MNTLTLTCETPDELIAGFGAGARINLQSSTTETGSYSNVTYIALVAATRQYTYEHLAGTSSTWYKVRFEDATGANANDYGNPFQVAPEGSGLICALWDVKQELGITVTTSDEILIEKIQQVGAAIMGYTGRRFVRTPASGTTTYLFDVDCSGYVLRVPQGIASISAVEVASQSQPDTGGTYTTVATTDWTTRPVTAERDYGWPATSVVILDTSSSYFVEGLNTVRLTMALGWAFVPYDIQAIALRAVVGSYMSKGSGAGGVAAAGPNGSTWILRTISPADKETLDWYRVGVVG